MMLKDNNFISAVVYLHNDGARAVEFCRTVAAELDANFKQYELVVVDDACTDDTVKQLRTWGREQDAPLTILHMSIYHGLEDAMNAGLDAAIGDYVYEFDSTELCYAPTLIMQAYRAALDGSDIVSVCPRTVRGGSSLFYKVFNAHSQSAYRLRTDAFRLVTRRAINRVHASSTHLPYRKAAYAASGLRMVDLEFDGQLTVKQKGRFNLALDSLTLYTNFGFKASVTVTLCMMALARVRPEKRAALAAGSVRAAAWRRAIFVVRASALAAAGSAAASAQTSRSRNGTRSSKLCAMLILSALSRMSPASHKFKSTCCIRVTGSSPSVASQIASVKNIGSPSPA